jgi:hypothetical protein
VVIVEYGTVAPVTALGIAPRSVEAILDASINAITPLNGAWLGIKMLALIKVVDAIDASPARMALSFFETQLPPHPR